jgi:hypothetical protein
MWERMFLCPVLFSHHHLWLWLWRRHLGTSGCSHLAGVTLINFLLVCLALPLCLETQAKLVLLYQLKACNLKTTVLVRGSKVTKRAWMTRGRIPVEAWMGTFDEVDFVPLYIL